MNEISYRRHRFPAAIIQHAVWLYFRFTLSYRDVEDLLAERGIDVSYETIRRWALKFGQAYARCGSRKFCPPQKSLDSRPLSVDASIAYAYIQLLHEPSMSTLVGLKCSNSDSI
jgi:putative transposase